MGEPRALAFLEESGSRRVRLPELPTRTVLRSGDVEVELNSMRVYRSGQWVHLASTEFRVLCVLLTYRDRVLTRTEILGAVWSGDPEVSPRVVDVAISRVRRALGAEGSRGPIRTVRGLGYVWDSPEREAQPSAGRSAPAR